MVCPYRDDPVGFKSLAQQGIAVEVADGEPAQVALGPRRARRREVAQEVLGTLLDRQVGGDVGAFEGTLKRRAVRTARPIGAEGLAKAVGQPRPAEVPIDTGDAGALMAVSNNLIPGSFGRWVSLGRRGGV